MDSYNKLLIYKTFPKTLTLWGIKWCKWC